MGCCVRVGGTIVRVMVGGTTVFVGGTIVRVTVAVDTTVPLGLGLVG